MRPIRSRTTTLLAAAIVLTGLLAPGAAADAAAETDAPAAAEALPDPADAFPGGQAGVDPAELPVEPPAQPARPGRRELFGADCETDIAGSHVTARCHNPYPRTDLVRLHIECDRWWDLDSDSVAVAVGPADQLQLTGRCWKEVRSAWVSHQRG
ncbi:hypothetical protein [Streptomyces sp. NPDC093225]|uniref:hypothetical protein n=1 Tax=Streptomyces sp. NPDC093225 TaxID=3366034 RepID=UPI0038158EC0